MRLPMNMKGADEWHALVSRPTLKSTREFEHLANWVSSGNLKKSAYNDVARYWFSFRNKN